VKFTRKELAELKNRALESSKIPHQNPLWTRVYLRIADALDCLDAMKARLGNKWIDVDEEKSGK